MSKLAQMLAEAAWTRGLTPEQRRRVDAETFSRVYPKGSHVFHHGEPVDYWMGVVDGLANRLLEPNARVALSLASLFNPILSPGTERTLQISQDEVGLAHMFTMSP